MKRKLLLSLLIGIVMSFIFSTALVANAATSKRQRSLRLGSYIRIEQEARISGTRRYYTGGDPAVYKEASFTETLHIVAV